jgi:hypothetical protein
MSRRHWDGLALLARMVGSTPSGVLSALVEELVNEIAEGVEALDDVEVEQ